MTTVFLDSLGYDFELEVDGEERLFNVGVVCRPPSTPTSLHFNERRPTNPSQRTTFGMHLPTALWKPVPHPEFEVICRKAIACAIQRGFFREPGHQDWYEYDDSVEPWEGELTQTR